MLPRTKAVWQRDSQPMASGKPGAVHFAYPSIPLRVFATDDSAWASQSFQLDVSSNSGGGGEVSLGTPIPDVSAYRGDAIDIEIPSSAFTVPTGETLSYSATLADGSAIPSWLTLDGDHFVGTIPATAIGELDIKLTAIDGSASVSDTFGLSIGIDTNPAITIDDVDQITEGNDRILSDEHANTGVNALGGDDYITMDAWNDGVSAGDGNDVIEMFGDNEWAYGDDKSDVFIFDSNAFLPSQSWVTDWGEIEDFTPGTDRVGIVNNVGGVSSFAQLQPFMAQSGSDVVINLTGLPTITLAGGRDGALPYDRQHDRSRRSQHHRRERPRPRERRGEHDGPHLLRRRP